MKKLLLLLLLLLLLIVPNFVFAAGSIKVSTYNITITEGSSKSFKVIASNAAGKVDILSSNTSIASVSSSGFWIENQSKTVTVSGKKVGSTTIKVILADAATFDSEELTGSYTINVNVKAKNSNSGSNNSGGSTNQNVSSKSSDNTLKSIEIDGYAIDFKSNVTSYDLNVENKVTSLNVKALTNHSKATVKINNVELKEGKNKIEIIVTAENKSKKTYTINVNRKIDSDVITITDLEDTLMNTKHDKIYILVNNNEIISKDKLDKIKNSNINVFVRKIDNDKILYEWNVSQGGINGDLNPNIDFSNNDEIDKITNYTKGIHFKLSKDILSNNKIKMYVGNSYEDGKILNLYDDKLQFKGNYEVKDGFIELNIADSSGYLITSASIQNKNNSIQNKNNLFLISSIVELFIIGYFILDKFVFSKTKKKVRKKGK